MASDDAAHPAAPGLIWSAADPTTVHIAQLAFSALLTGRTPSLSELGSAAGRGDVDAVVATLQDAGLAERDGDLLVGFGGLTTRPTAHAIELGGRRLHTWCAFDTIGIPAALGVSADAHTTCPHCGTAVTVHIHDGEPEDTGQLVGFWPTSACTRTMEDFCPSANVFCSTSHLTAWAAEAGNPAGETLALAELAIRGRATWAVFAGAWPRTSERNPHELSDRLDRRSRSHRKGDTLNIELQYFQSCPHWHEADQHLREALQRAGLDAVTVNYLRIETADQATETAFRGSPTILIDGHDPFGSGDMMTGLSCRIYQTPHGPRGAPTVQQLVHALRPNAS